MREYVKKPEIQSRTLDSNPKASRQAPIDVILQRYKEPNIQRYAEDEELRQGKFDTAQREKTEDNELMQRKFESFLASEQDSIQREEKPNNTGLPDNLKTGIENLSGYSMDDVKVHYNSDKPAQLNALAYAQGTDIHVAPRQEQHLPHEAWHVVQQKQGRVQPTMQLQKVNVNDNQGLEKEADMMGSKAIHTKPGLLKLVPHIYKGGSNVIQQVNINGDVVSQKVLEIYNGLDPAIKSYILATAKMGDFFSLPENNQIKFLLLLQSYLPVVDSFIRQQSTSRTIMLNSTDSVDMVSLRMKFFLANPDFINEALKLYRNMSATFNFPTIDGFTTIIIPASKKLISAVKPIEDNSGFMIKTGVDRQTPTREQTYSGGHGTKLSAGDTQNLCLGWATAVHLQKSGIGYRIVKLITQKSLSDETTTLQSRGEVGEDYDKYTVYETNAVGQTITRVFTLAVSSCSFTVLGDARNTNIVIMHTDAKPRIPLEQVLGGGVLPTIFTRMCISRVESEKEKEEEIVKLMSLETIVRNLRDDDYSEQGAIYDMPKGAHAYIGVDLHKAPQIYGQVGATQELVSGVASFLMSEKTWIKDNCGMFDYFNKKEIDYEKQILELIYKAYNKSSTLYANLDLLLNLIKQDYINSDRPKKYLWDTITEYATDIIPENMKSRLAAEINKFNGHFDQPL